MADFEIGDIVRLYCSEGYNYNRYNSCRLFSIEEIGDEVFILKDIVEPVDKNHVIPVRINNQEDCDIYLIYPHHTTYNYYTGDASRAYYMKTLQQKYHWIYSKVCNYEYVHEIQHFLRRNKDLRMSLAIDI